MRLLFNISGQMKYNHNVIKGISEKRGNRLLDVMFTPIGG